MKNPPFLVFVLITCKIICSKDVQCNTRDITWNLLKDLPEKCEMISLSQMIGPMQFGYNFAVHSFWKTIHHPFLGSQLGLNRFYTQSTAWSLLAHSLNRSPYSNEPLRVAAVWTTSPFSVFVVLLKGLSNKPSFWVVLCNLGFNFIYF